MGDQPPRLPGKVYLETPYVLVRWNGVGQWVALDRKLSFPDAPDDRVIADVAQLAEQPPRKWQVVSSNLTVGSIKMPLWLMTNLQT
jgi:hypothetical protein